jgi:hypothetical protein
LVGFLIDLNFSINMFEILYAADPTLRRYDVALRRNEKRVNEIEQELLARLYVLKPGWGLREILQERYPRDEEERPYLSVFRKIGRRFGYPNSEILARRGRESLGQIRDGMRRFRTEIEKMYVSYAEAELAETVHPELRLMLGLYHIYEEHAKGGFEGYDKFCRELDEIRSSLDDYRSSVDGLRAEISSCRKQVAKISHDSATQRAKRSIDSTFRNLDRILMESYQTLQDQIARGRYPSASKKSRRRAKHK